MTTTAVEERTGVRGRTTADTLLRIVCGVQGVYYLVTGVWPLVSIDTFQAVTGPKTDLWLVRTVGVLIAVIALVLLWATRGRPTSDVALLAVGSALGLTAIDFIYVSGRVIDPIYLADAAAELILILAWAVCLVWRAKDGSRPQRESSP
jgi:hypothetical protein